VAKLVMVIVQDEDAGRLVNGLRDEGLPLTRLRSSGGFLGAANATIVMGLEDDQVPVAMRLIDEHCEARTMNVPMELLGGMDANWLPTEVTHGGATVFVLEMAELRRI
jgi:uncharacterized protein YaaQ